MLILCLKFSAVEKVGKEVGREFDYSPTTKSIHERSLVLIRLRSLEGPTPFPSL